MTNRSFVGFCANNGPTVHIHFLRRNPIYRTLSRIFSDQTEAPAVKAKSPAVVIQLKAPTSAKQLPSAPVTAANATASLGRPKKLIAVNNKASEAMMAQQTPVPANKSAEMKLVNRISKSILDLRSGSGERLQKWKAKLQCGPITNKKQTFACSPR